MAKRNKPKMGRRPRAEQSAKYVLTIRLTDGEKATILRASGDEPMSEWARRILTRAANRSTGRN